MLTITIAWTSYTTVKTLAKTFFDYCVLFVADFLRFSLNHSKETRVDIFTTISESCAMMDFAGKKRCVSRLFSSMQRPLPPTQKSVFSARRTETDNRYTELGRPGIGQKFIVNPGYLAGLIMICGQNNK